MAMAPSNSLETIFSQIINDKNDKSQQDLGRHLQSTVDPDGKSLATCHLRDHLLDDLVGGGRAKEVRIDAILVDNNTQGVAARLINRVPVIDSPKTFEYQEIVIANFTNGLLSTWRTVRDEDDVRSQRPTVPSTPSSLSTTQQPSGKTRLELKSFYRNYIRSINAKTMRQEFDQFCQPVLKHNDREFTIAEYIPLISDSQEAIQGLHFHIQELLADENTQQIAARLEFTGTPVSEWGGVEPNGKSVNFHEHVMYQLEQGKISRVWSTIELGVYRDQMGKDVS